MKKLTIILGIISCSLLANGQFSVGISGGSNISKMYVNLRDLTTFRIKPVVGLNLNLILDYQINSNLSLHSGLGLSQKGFKHSIDNRVNPQVDSTIEMISKLNYIEIPLYLNFNTNLNHLEVFYGIGPFLSYAINGKITTNLTGRNDITYADEIKFSKNTDYLTSQIVREYRYADIRRFDYGVGSMFGVEFHRITLSISYQYSLSNLLLEYSLDEAMSNSTLSVSLGYQIK